MYVSKAETQDIGWKPTCGMWDWAKGHAWCAAFVSWLHGQAGYALPRSGWSPSLFPASKCIPRAKAAAVFGIYVPAVKRIAHVGLVTGLRGDWINTIEGNTNPAGSREGDGVYRRLRHRRAVNRYAYYLQSIILW